MKYQYTLDINDLSQKIKISVRLGESPFALTHRISRKDMLYGGVTDNKIWLMKTTPLKNRIPQRFFRGKMYTVDKYTVIEGRFYFQLEEIIFFFAISMVLAVSSLLCFNTPVGFVEIIEHIIFICLLGLLTWMISWLFYRKEERYVKAFLKGLGDTRVGSVS